MIQLTLTLPDVDGWDESAIDDLLVTLAHVSGQVAGLRYVTGCDLTGLRPIHQIPGHGGEHIRTWRIDVDACEPCLDGDHDTADRDGKCLCCGQVEGV